jgi:hypothetical protein
MMPTPRSLIAGAFAALLAAAPALASGPTAAPVLIPVQAEAPMGWTQHSAMGVTMWLPPELEVAHGEEEIMVFAAMDSQSYGEMEVIVTTMPQAYSEIMGELSTLPPHLTLERGTRAIPGLGQFEELLVDGRNDPEDPAIVRVLAAPQESPGTGRLLILIAGFEPMDDGAADWDRIRTLVDEIATRISGSGA